MERVTAELCSEDNLLTYVDAMCQARDRLFPVVDENIRDRRSRGLTTQGEEGLQPAQFAMEHKFYEGMCCRKRGKGTKWKTNG